MTARIDLDELERLHQLATTNGPWFGTSDGTMIGPIGPFSIGAFMVPADAQVAAASVNALPALLAAVRAAEPFARKGRLIESERQFEEMDDRNEVAVIATVKQVDTLRDSLAVFTEGKA